MAEPTVTVQPQGWITFHGTAFKNSGFSQDISVLLGDDPPKITDGYAQWQTIARPLSRGISVFQGYNPTQMELSVRFGRWSSSGWNISDQASQDVENDIKWMGWMAGEGFSSGQSPAVWVDAYKYPSGTSELIPLQWQGSKVAWVISALSWGQAWRNLSTGQRTYQEATVTLMQYLSYGKPPKDTNQDKGGYFKSKPGRDTALLITGAPLVKSPPAYHETLARRIITDPLNARLRLRSTKQKIRHGEKVFVPAHTI